MELLSTINAAIQDMLGPLGPIIIAGALGLIMVALTVVMMLRQPKDPMEKLKRAASGKVDDGKQREQLRQGGHNQQLDKFASFLEPQDTDEFGNVSFNYARLDISPKTLCGTSIFPKWFWESLVLLVASCTSAWFFLPMGQR